MTINGFVFFWLVVFAVIGILATVLGGAGVFALVHLEITERREKRREYEGMKQALFSQFEPQ